ncbi:hypothetical protein CVU75_00860 [Candidatus Dependentiae bacterium HGW-Dependentiae-1]|nr:MAG: hypothetical protein CVU75_00860 [Candidatus Dependentiae bacterium HGW-Dependentiae-1]
MLKNCRYDQMKLLYTLSCTAWFIEKHAKTDAQKENNAACLALLENLEKDLKKYTDQLNTMLSAQ